MRVWNWGGVLHNAGREGLAANTQSMKSPFTLTLVTTIAMIIASSAAFADDQQLQTRQSNHRAQAAKQNQSATIGVHTHRGLGRSENATTERRTDSKFEVRSNAKGHQYGLFVPVK